MSKRRIQSLTATITGKPKTWPRTQAQVTKPDGTRIRVNPQAYRTWKTETADKLAAMAGYRTFSGEVAVRIDLGSNDTRVEVVELDGDDQRRKPTGLRGDIDNYAKAVLDALQASGVVTDDRVVAQLEVRFRP